MATILVCANSLLSAQAAASDSSLVFAHSPETILHYAQNHGPATLSTDRHGDPLIQVKNKISPFEILFYDCNNGKTCESIQFRAVWEGAVLSMEAINDWNSRKRFGKAYYGGDGTSLILEMSITLTDGISGKNLDDNFKWWMLSLTEFYSDEIKN